MGENTEFLTLINNLLKAIEEGRACTKASFEKSGEVLQIVHSQYGDELNAFYNYIFEHELFDSNYNANCDLIRNKLISDMTFDELMSMFTLFTRSEKFCDGAMYETIQKGKMTACLERLKELI